MDFLDRPNLEKPHKTPTSQAKPGANTKKIRRQYRVKLDRKITPNLQKLAKLCKSMQLYIYKLTKTYKN